MKRFGLIIILLFTCIISLKAQKYHGEVLVGGMVGLGEDFGTMATICTSHGVVFEGDTFIGVGIGAGSNLAGKLELPLYGKIAQTFNLFPNMQVYAGLSTGACLNENLSYGLYMAPEVGLQAGRIKFFINYSYRNLLNEAKEAADGKILYNTFKSHCFGAGIGFAFGRH